MQKSLSLLPTAPAHLTLGQIAARRGDRSQAIEHYRVVAQGEGEVALQAQSNLVRLDVSQNPGNYVQKRCDPGSDGNLVVSVRNATQLPLRNIVVQVTYSEGAAQRQMERRLNGTLAAGEVASVATGLGPYAAGSSCPAVVSQAQVAE